MLYNMAKAALTAFFAFFTTQQVARLVHPQLQKHSLPVTMGLAKTYGVIAATALTSTGNTLIAGDCGTWPGKVITGFPPGACTGVSSAGGTPATNAQAACLTAYNNCKGASPSTALPSNDLAGMTLPPGIYTFPIASARNTGTFTADGATNAQGQWIFQISTSFTAAGGSKVVLKNGAQACNIYFQSGSSITIGGGSTLNGNYLAYTSVTVGAASTNNGTLCSLNTAVTLINDGLTAQPVCTS